MEPIREFEVFDVLRAIERGALALTRGEIVQAGEGEDDVEFRLPTGWRFLVALEAGDWGGILEVDAPDGRRLVLGDPPFTHDDMPALCEYHPAGEDLARWLSAAASGPPAG